MARTVILGLRSMRPEIERATTETGFESSHGENDDNRGRVDILMTDFVAVRVEVVMGVVVVLVVWWW